MRIIRAVAVVLTVLAVLSGCERSGVSRLDYADRAFESEIVWTLDRVRYRAVLVVGDPTESGKVRDVSLRFLEPDSLFGVKAERIDGGYHLSLGDTVFDGTDISGLFGIAELFRTDGVILSSSIVTLGGEAINLVKLTRGGNEEISVYISSDSGAPVRICGAVGGREICLDVLRFDRKAPRE